MSNFKVGDVIISYPDGLDDHGLVSKIVYVDGDILIVHYRDEDVYHGHYFGNEFPDCYEVMLYSGDCSFSDDYENDFNVGDIICRVWNDTFNPDVSFLEIATVDVCFNMVTVVKYDEPHEDGDYETLYECKSEGGGDGCGKWRVATKNDLIQRDVVSIIESRGAFDAAREIIELLKAPN